MIKFVKNNRQKIIVAIITFVMIISAIPFISLAEDSNINTTTQVIANVRTGKIQNSNDQVKTEVSFTIKDPTGIKHIYWMWDRDFKPQSECDRGVLHPEGTPTEYTFSMPVSFADDDLGLHEFAIRVYNGENKASLYKIFPYNVVNEEVPDNYRDPNEQVQFFGIGEYGCPPSGSQIEPNRKFKLKLEDEDYVFYFVQKWVKGTVPESSYKANATVTFKPENGIVEFYAPAEPGPYVLQFFAVNGANHDPEGHYYIYNVVDTEAPVLTLNEPDNNEVELGGTYTDPGAQWTDNVDGTGTVYSEDKIDTSIVGPQTIKYTVTDSSGNTAEITRTVTVVGTEPSYKLVLPSKTEYMYGEDLDLSDAKLLYIDERGNTIREETITPDMFENFSTTNFTDISNITESKKATFKYNNLSVDYNYTVTQAVDRIEVTQNPTNTVYEYGDNIDLSGGNLSVIYQTGYSKTVDLSEATIKTFDPNLVGTEQTIVISYNDKETNLNITINKRNVTVTIDPVESFYGEEIKAISYKLATDSSLADGDTLDDLGIIATTTATSTSNVGSYPITVTASNNKYNVTIAGNSTYEIKAASLVDDDLTVTAPTDLIYNGSAKTVTVNSNQNKTFNTEITYTGKNTTSGSAINAGNYTATVTITGTGNYTGTITKSVDFTIAAKALTITANDASSLYGTPVATNGYTITDSEGNVITDSNLTVELTINNVTASSNAQTYEDAITANVTAGNEDNNFDITYVAGNYTITPATLKAADIKVSDPNIFIYDGNAKEVTVTINNNKTANIEVVYTGANVTNGSAINAGNYTATITATGTGNYTGTVKKKVDVIINAKSLTITANNVTTDFGREVSTNGYTITDSEGNTITDLDLTVNLAVDNSITTTTNVGTYTDVIMPNVTAGNESNNYKITYVAGDYTINPAPLIDDDLTVTAPTDLIYNGSAKTVTVNSNQNKTFNTEITYTGKNTTNGSAINAGNYTATVTITGTGNYTGTITKSVDFTIAAKSLTITANDASSLYGAPIATNGYTITDSEGNVITDSNLTVELTVNNVTSSSDAKTYEDAITANVTAGNEDNNFDITYVAGNYTINPASLADTDVTVSAPNNLVFDGTAKEVIVTINNNKTANIDVQYIGTNVIDNQAIKAGNYTANITVTGTGNYTGTITKTIDFTISGNELTITANNVSKEYGAPVESNGYIITDSEGNEIENPGLSIEVIVDNSITSTSNIGIYTDAVTVNVTAGNEDNNYAITYVAGNYEITAATIAESDVTFNIPGEPINETYNGILYNGDTQTASISITKYENTLLEDTDYTLTTKYSVWDSTASKYVELEDGQLPTETGTYRVNFLINGTGNYVGRISKNRFYRIQPATISEEDITFNYPGEPLDATYNGVEYNGDSQTATVTIVKDEKTLEENKDYTLTAVYATWDSEAKKYVQLEDGKLPTEVGAYRVALTITGTGNYTGKVSKTKFYKILVSTISEENVTFNFPGEVLDDTYNGVEYDPNGHRATVTVEKDNKTLKENQDYTTSITYSVWDSEAKKYVPLADGEIPTEMGAYRIAIIVRGTGNYNGAASKTRYLKIQQEQIKEEDIKITIPTDLEYDGNPKQISVEIINGKTANYTIKYTGNNTTDGEAINVGEYTATVTAKGTGEFGGEATKSVVFTIIDTTIPEITLIGDDTVTVEVGTEYSDLGATATDNYDGDITSKIIVDTTDVDTTTLGTYTVTYNVVDSSNNSAIQVVRTVEVVDTTAPVITIDGPELIVIEKGNTYTLPNATATDNYDGTVNVTNDSSKIDTNKAGEYTITYTAKDSSNNTTTKTITLRILDLYKLHVQEGKMADLEIFASDDIFEPLNENKNDYTEQSINEKQALIDNFKEDYNNILSGNSSITLEELTQEYVDNRIKEIEDFQLVSAGLNKEKYNSVLETIENLVESDYTEATWNELMSKKDTDISSITIQSSLNVVTYKIEQAIKDLEPIDFRQHVNKTTTGLYMKLTTDYVRSDYTDESYRIATDALFEPAYQTIYYPQYPGNINLKSEFDKLVAEFKFEDYLVAKPVDQSKLDAIEAEMSKLNPNHYTPESWKALEDKIAEARNITDLQSKFDNAMKDISIDDLVVLDNEPPVITLTGDEVVTIEVGSEYVDAGATATDNYDGDITANIVTDSDVDTNTVGEYTVTFNVTDSNGNAADQVTRTVKVVDTTDPVIIVDDENNVYSMKAGNEKPKFNATATDNYDKTVNVVITDDIDTTTPGKYTVTFTATDSNGNKATETREFTVINSIAPTITLDVNNVYRMEVGGTIPSLNATAMDIDNNIVEVKVDTTNINPNRVGKYKVIFTATDKNDNTETIEKDFYVIDTTIPVITLTGDKVVTIEVGSAYVDAGATANDNYDGDITANIVTVNPVDTSKVAEYTVTYNVTDANGNAAVEVTRTVKVVDTTKPVITLTGDEVVTIEVGSEYVDAGATATDNYDGNITVNIVTDTSDVDTHTVGTYTVTFNVTDSNGNVADQVTRVVNVVDTTKPVITLDESNVYEMEINTTKPTFKATAEDNYDGVVLVEINDNIQTNTVGTYTVTFTATDKNNNTAIVTKEFKVIDTIKPVITLDENNVYTMKVGQPKPTFAATATDNSNEIITVEIKDTIDITTPGTYQVTFTAKDSSGNTEKIVKDFVVVEADKLIVDMTGYTLENKTTTYNTTAQGVKLSKDGVETDILPEGITNVRFEYTDSANNTTTIAPTNAGTYTVKAIFTVDSKYNKVEDMTSTLIINKANYDMSKVVFNNAEYIYDGTTSRSLTLDESTLPNGVTLVGYEGNGKVEIGTYTITAKFAITDTTNYNVPANMTATLTIVEDYVKSLHIDQKGNKTYKSGEAINREDILSIIDISKVMASNTLVNLTASELANVQMTVDGKPLPVDTTPYAGTLVNVTVSYEGTTANVTVFVEGTEIKYLANNSEYAFEDGTVFDDSVALTWSSNEVGTLTYPDGHTEPINKGFSISGPGNYTITVGNVSKTFEIKTLSFDDLATFDSSTKILTLNNIDKIESIAIGSQIYTKAEGNLSNTYTLTRGKISVTIYTTSGKELSKTLIVR